MYVLKTTRQLYQSILPGAERMYNTVYVWCSDGWMYDLFSMIRRKYVSTHRPGILEIVEEKFKDAAIQDIQHQEEVYVTVFSESPMVWTETTDGKEELFVETAITPPNMKNVRFSEPPPLRLS